MEEDVQESEQEQRTKAWRQVLAEYLKHFDGVVRNGDAEPLSGLERINLEMFTNWLSYDYCPPEKVASG